MEGVIFNVGNQGCHHYWEDKSKDWEEGLCFDKDGNVRKDMPKAQYYGMVRVCKLCSREELLGGTVVVPGVKGVCLGGEYVLEPDGSHSFCIS